MRKGFSIGPEMMVAVILAVIIIGFGVQFLFSEKIQSSEPPEKTELAECKVNFDCRSSDSGRLCITVDYGSSFCGCLDESDCPTLGQKCFNRKCIA